jgi:hypothetical protein
MTSLAGLGILPVPVFYMVNRTMLYLLFMDAHSSMTMNATYLMIITA